MINKSLDQVANELAESIKRISKITDLSKFYEVQQKKLNQKEDEKLYEVIAQINNT